MHRPYYRRHIVGAHFPHEHAIAQLHITVRGLRIDMSGFRLRSCSKGKSKKYLMTDEAQLNLRLLPPLAGEGGDGGNWFRASALAPTLTLPRAFRRKGGSLSAQTSVTVKG